MEFFDAVEARQAIRAYLPTPVEPEKLHAILGAVANRAPSAGNLQAYRVYVVTSPSHRQALSRASVNRRGLHQTFLAEAPVVLVFCADPEQSAKEYGDRGRQLYSIQDATIACCFASLAAAALGLGSVFVGAFDEDAVRRIVDAPAGIRPITLLPIGYPAERQPRRERRPMSEVVHEIA